jgi:hypothetical protein
MMNAALISPPEEGQPVSVRTRHWDVNDVQANALPHSPLKPSSTLRQHLVTLTSIEDDVLGDELQVLWELEPGAKMIPPPKNARNSKGAAAFALSSPPIHDALKLPESRVIADLLLRGTDAAGWREAILGENVLQARSPETAARLARLIRGRLEGIGPELWRLVRDGNGTVAAHAALAAAVKHSRLLGDFLDLVVREQFRLFSPKLTCAMWEDYLNDCRGRDADMPFWNESTRRRLRSSVFQTLAQAGYLADTKSLKLQPVHIARQVIDYLQDHDEAYVLRCIQVSP